MRRYEAHDDRPTKTYINVRCGRKEECNEVDHILGQPEARLTVGRKLSQLAQEGEIMNSHEKPP
jgi:hypothetical protein